MFFFKRKTADEMRIRYWSQTCALPILIGMAGSVNEACSLISQLEPDLVFLDIELQTGTGFEVLNSLQSLQFDVVFTTAFEHYAIKAIKFSSIDYLLKPRSEEHTSELQSLMRISYAVFCLKQKKKSNI